VIRRQIFITGFITLALTVFAQDSPDTTLMQIRVGQNAPSFALPKLDLKYISLRDYCGEDLRKPWINKVKHVVILSFFATWCKPCIAEIPHLEKLKRDFEGLPIKFFLIDVGEEKEKVVKFAQKRDVKLTILLDRYNKIAEKYGVLSLPRLFVLDKNGIIRKMQSGFSDPKQFEKDMFTLILELLEESGAETKQTE
jgi:thiol-disulfide isomerase/thioredoxin